jgi:hypothetical protein
MKKDSKKSKEVQTKLDEIKDNPDENVSVNIKKKEEKQLIWVFVFIILSFVVFLFVYGYLQNINSFKFIGLEWEKTKIGTAEFYYSLAPVAQNYYYNLYLTQDPRKNDIPISGKIELDKSIILSLEPVVGSCEDAQVGNIFLSQFLAGGVGASIEAGFTDKELADSQKVLYADCDVLEKGKSIINIKKAETSSIIRNTDGENCYTIYIKDCSDYLPGVEKFVLGLFAQAYDKTSELA